MRIVICLILSFLISGCTVSRGFLMGAMGGVAMVDEFTRGEAESGSAHSELKMASHQMMGMVTGWFIWPVAVTYAGLSGIYGAYQFYKWDLKYNSRNKKNDIIMEGLK